MKTNKNSIQNSVIRVAAGTIGLLLIPFVGMMFSTDWNWELSDFIIMGILLFGTGFMIELIRHRMRNDSKKIAFIIAIIFGFLYLWAELAVGIFTNWGS